MFYENYLNSLKADTSYIPESVSEMDKCIFAERAFQDALNESFFAIATQEMAMFESAINEAEGDKPAASPEAKKNLLDIIKKAATTIWEKAKGFYLDTIDNVKKTFAKFKKEKGDKIKADFKASAAKLPADFVAKGIYNFGDAKAVYDKAMKGAAGVGTYVQKAMTDPEMDYSKEAVVKAAGYDSVESFKADGVKVTKSDVKGSDISSNADAIIKVVFDAGGWLKMIKLTYNHNKKVIDSCLKTAKSAINSSNTKEVNKLVKSYISLCKEATSVLCKHVGISNSTIRAIRTNYVALVAKVVAKGKKPVKEDTEITIGVKDESPEDTEVKVDAPTAGVKDEIEEACAGFISEETDEDVELNVTTDENEGCKSCKEDVDIEVNVEDSDDEVEDVEESALYKALCAYLG